MTSDLAGAQTTRYFEDFRPGMVFELGERSVSEQDMVRVATEFDPQVFHVDPIAAKDTFFEGLVASGWHTVGIFLQMYVTELIVATANMAGLGIDRMRFLAPLRPGDVVTARAHVLSTRLSASRPDGGVLVTRWELALVDGPLVLQAESAALIRRRPDESCRPGSTSPLPRGTGLAQETTQPGPGGPGHGAAAAAPQREEFS